MCYLISETKTDSCFPSALFHMGDYATPYRLDDGVGTMLYIKEDIPPTLVISDLSMEKIVLFASLKAL